MGGGRYTSGGAGRSTKFVDFGAGQSAVDKSTKFYHEHSNFDEWESNLSSSGRDAIQAYTGEGYMSYHTLNGALYTQNYDDMDSEVQSRVDAIHSEMSKFVLTKGIQVTRQCDFKIFGAGKGEKMTVSEIKDFIKKNGDNGVLTNRGLLSSGSNNHGAAIDGSGLVIHFKVPPSIGAGAYINPISWASGASENEFLFSAYSKFKFDVSSMHVDNKGKIHINARWVGVEDYKKKWR